MLVLVRRVQCPCPQSGAWELLGRVILTPGLCLGTSWGLGNLPCFLTMGSTSLPQQGPLSSHFPFLVFSSTRWPELSAGHGAGPHFLGTGAWEHLVFGYGGRGHTRCPWGGAGYEPGPSGTGGFQQASQEEANGMNRFLAAPHPGPGLVHGSPIALIFCQLSAGMSSLPAL